MNSISNNNCDFLASVNQELTINLIGLSREGLKILLLELGESESKVNMRVSQIWNWLYVHGVQNITDMLNISAILREKLSQRCMIFRPKIIAEQRSNDGTIKWLLQFPPKGKIAIPVEAEAVFIPEKERGTLCVSSQVGCTLNCTFCHTGTQQLVRNLGVEEILGQILLVRDKLNDWPGSNIKSGGTYKRALTNIVMMGMGEPFYNYDAVKDALLIACDPSALAFSKRRVTISTSGVVPKIVPAGEDIGVMLAVSLHASNNAVRDKLVPLNRKYPIEILMKECENYPGLSKQRKITFEYVMIKDINDSIEDALKLVKLLDPIPAKVNLIPFNAWPGSVYECSNEETINSFADVLLKAGYLSPVRRPRGQDIMAACGQLKTCSARK